MIHVSGLIINPVLKKKPLLFYSHSYIYVYVGLCACVYIYIYIYKGFMVLTSSLGELIEDQMLQYC